MRGTCVIGHRVTPSMISRGSKSRNSEHLMRERRQFAGGPRPPFLAGFRPAFSPPRPVAVFFGAHCTISYENGSANYRPRAPRSFSRCKCALRGSRLPSMGGTEEPCKSVVREFSRRCTRFSIDCVQSLYLKNKYVL